MKSILPEESSETYDAGHMGCDYLKQLLL